MSNYWSREGRATYIAPDTMPNSQPKRVDRRSRNLPGQGLPVNEILGSTPSEREALMTRLSINNQGVENGSPFTNSEQVPLPPSEE